MFGRERAYINRMAALGAANAEVVSTDEHAVCTGVDAEAQLPTCALVLAGFLALTLLALRRTDVIFHPQFLAEDGTTWYAQAYQYGGWRALLLPASGYFSLLPHIAAGLSLLVPLHLAPLVMNFVGLVVQAVPAVFVLSSRCGNWGRLRLRSALAFVYILLPNSAETHATVTNAQWHLAVLMLLVITAIPPKTKTEHVFDIACLTISGLTGPYCLLVLPIAVLYCWRFRDARRVNVLLGLAVLSLLQLIPMVVTIKNARGLSDLGASPERFLRLMGGHVVFGSLWGMNHLATTGSLPILLIATIIGTTLVTVCLWKAPLPWKALLLFTGLVLASCLQSPYVPGSPAWAILMKFSGLRYWYLPTLAICWCLVWLFSRYNITRPVIVLLLSVAMLRDFRLDPLPTIPFEKAALAFERAPVGTEVNIPINPPGWSCHLIKRF